MGDVGARLEQGLDRLRTQSDHLGGRLNPHDIFDNLTSWHGERFLRTVVKAVEGFDSVSGFRPGLQLKYVASDYSIYCNSVQDLRLRVVSKGELMQHEKAGAQVYEFKSCGLLRP